VGQNANRKKNGSSGQNYSSGGEFVLMQRNINKSARGLHVQGADRLPERQAPIGLLVVLTIVVCAVVLVTHWPALSAKALSFDDDQYFVKNFLVRNPSWESARRFLTEVFEPSTVRGYYQPLTMISLMLDYAIGGQTDDIMMFHRTSLLLHVANTALIIVLLYQLFGWVWVAAGVGLLFGVHPLTVESIPWVGGRKTLLAAFFALWSLVLYVRFVRKGNSKVYYGSIVMYALALMSKPTSTPLPVLMLLMDYWPLRRLSWRTVQEKLPFFVIGGISAVITYISQSRTSLMITPEAYGLMRVPLVICHNIIFYLYKMVWPANLTSHYPFPDPFGFSIPMVMIGVIGTCVLLLLLLVLLRWTRAAITGWLIFFVMVFPTMQMLQFSDVIASDKFVYLPSVGILMVVAAFLGWMCGLDNVRQNKVRCIIATIIVVTLAGTESFATRRYLANWKDSLSLCTYMVKVTPNAVPPLYNLGVALAEQGRIDEAIALYRQELAFKPLSSQGILHAGLGALLLQQSKLDEAISEFQIALKLVPSSISSMTLNNLAIAMAQQGRFDEAIEYFYKVVKMKPNDIEAHYNLAVALVEKNRFEEAASVCRQALRLQPRDADAHCILGDVLIRQNRIEEAAAEYREALRINPQHPQAQEGLKNIRSKQ
jgi:protein O-mannosyl-transferase